MVQSSPESQGLSYWLQWQVFVCALIILVPLIGAAVLIGKVKRDPLKSSDLWMPCWRGLHPIWLLIYRAFVVVFMSWMLYETAVEFGAVVFFFYTQWTFVLVIVYFALGTIISAHGCWKYAKTPVNRNEERDHLLKKDSKAIKSSETNKSGGSITSQDYPEQQEAMQTAGTWGYVMQIIYQICAGAVMLTDIVFWGLLLPFQSEGEFTLTWLIGCMHGVNLVFLLIDTALNRLPFPWFRLAYFVFWSCTYIIFQWTLHACCISWWPYIFLELSTPWAPLWYFALVLVHLLCYGLYVWIVKAKFFIFSMFPGAYVRSY